MSTPLAHEYRQEIKDIGRSLNDGEQLSGQLCPWCKGGASHEGSLSIKRIGNKCAYNCHRATCYMRGDILLVPLLEEQKQPEFKARKRESKYDAKNLELVPLPEEIVKEIERKYLLTPDNLKDAGWMWSPKYKRAWIPLIGLASTAFGGQLRSFEKGAFPKSIIVLHRPYPQPCTYYYGPGTIDELVLLEDAISAKRMARYKNSLALCGTNLSEGLVAALQHSRFNKLRLVLDADAFTKALSLQKKYGALFEEFTVHKPEVDIKDMSHQQLQIFIRSTLGVPN